MCTAVHGPRSSSSPSLKLGGVQPRSHYLPRHRTESAANEATPVHPGSVQRAPYFIRVKNSEAPSFFASAPPRQSRRADRALEQAARFVQERKPACTTKTLDTPRRDRRRYICACIHLLSVDHVKARRGDKSDLRYRDYGNRCCHGDGQGHQEQPGRADTHDR